MNSNNFENLMKKVNEFIKHVINDENYIFDGDA